MNKIIYILDNNQTTDYHFEIDQDTIVFHYSINSSSSVSVKMKNENINLSYYYNNINYDDNKFHISVYHEKSNTHSELYNHGVNVKNNKLDYYVEGIVPKDSTNCICNQENQIINMGNGKSTICPNLLIDNYDVVSNHSAYIGSFSEDNLFYLMSRGISRDEANYLLLHGFLINSSVDKDRIELFLKELANI